MNSVKHGGAVASGAVIAVVGFVFVAGFGLIGSACLFAKDTITRPFRS